jgi:hypothetical protein
MYHTLKGCPYYNGANIIHYYKKNVIKGLNTICKNSTQVYSLAGLPGGCTVSWSCSGSGVVSSTKPGDTSNSFNVTSNSNVGGTGTILATVHQHAQALLLLLCLLL